MTDSTAQATVSPLHLTHEGKDYIYLTSEQAEKLDKKKHGWYHLDVPADGSVPDVKNRLSDKECEKLGVSHDDSTVHFEGEQPAEVITEETPTDASLADVAKEIGSASVDENMQLCAASLRKGTRRFATHIICVDKDASGNDITEYRCIEEIGPKSDYHWARSL